MVKPQAHPPVNPKSMVMCMVQAQVPILMAMLHWYEASAKSPFRVMPRLVEAFMAVARLLR